MMNFHSVVRILRPAVAANKRMFASATAKETATTTTTTTTAVRGILSRNNQKFSSMAESYDSDSDFTTTGSAAAAAGGGLDPNAKYTTVAASPRQLCDFELIANGGFDPLNGFMGQAEYENVCTNYRLTNGALWPIPIVMDIDEATKIHLESNDGKLLITDANGTERGILHVEQIYKPDKKMEGDLVYGGNKDHCEIININTNVKEYYVGGRVEVLSLPEYEDYKDLRRTPKEVKQFFQDNNWDKVVAFQTRNPMHFAHIELTKLAAERIGAKVCLCFCCWSTNK